MLLQLILLYSSTTFFEASTSYKMGLCSSWICANYLAAEKQQSEWWWRCEWWLQWRASGATKGLGGRLWGSCHQPLLSRAASTGPCCPHQWGFPWLARLHPRCRSWSSLSSGQQPPATVWCVWQQGEVLWHFMLLFIDSFTYLFYLYFPFFIS